MTEKLWSHKFPVGYRQKLKDALLKATGCGIQHDGWCCGTCFFAIDEDDGLTNKDWQTVLLIRGDYKEEELMNLPKNLLGSYRRILKACGVEPK
jgi:hypothetical protein